MAQISDQVLGWVVLADLDGTLAAAASQAGLMPGTTDLGQLKRDLGQMAGVPGDVMAAVDGKRPIGVLFLDPGRRPPTAKARPFVFSVPVSSRQDLLTALRASGSAIEAPGQHDVAFALRDGTRAYVHFPDDRRALLAFEPDLALAGDVVLAPHLGRPPAQVVVHAAMDTLMRAYGQELDGLIVATMAALLEGSAGASAQTAHTMRQLSQVAAHLPHASALELRAGLSKSGLLVTLRLEGDAKGELGTYVTSQRPGPTWGARFIPRDAMLVYGTHMNREGIARDAESLVDYLVQVGGSAGKEPPAARREAMKKALVALGEGLGGEAVYAVWPGTEGGLGLGGAFRLTEGAATEGRVVAAYRAIAPALGAATAQQLGLDPARFKFKVKVRPAGVKLGETPVDVVELTPRWPKKSAEARTMFEWLFGPKLVLGVATVDGQELYAAGRDWRSRLETMVATARGSDTAGSILDVPAFARADRTRPTGRVSLAYVPTAGLARFVAGVLAATQDGKGGGNEGLLEPFLGAGGEAPIVVTTNVVRRGDVVAYEIASELPSPALRELGRLGGAMWRVALGPILGPPTVPPLPAPPPNVTPPPDTAVPSPDEGEAPGAPPGGVPGSIPTGRGA